MDEVSCRAWSYFRGAIDAKWVDRDALLEGCRYSVDHLDNPRNRVDWDEWARLCDRYAALVGDERLTASARFVLSEGFAGRMAQVASLFADPAHVYRAGIEWVAPSLYRGVRFTFAADDHDVLRITAELPPEYRPSRAWFRMFRDGLAVVPRFAGMSESVIEGTMDDRRATLRVVPPPGRSVWLLLRRLWLTLRAPQALLSELAFQQSQLRDTSLALAAKDRALRDTLGQLPALVGLLDGDVLTYANAALLTALGATDDEARAGPLTDRLVPEHRAAFTEVIDGARAEAVVQFASGRWVEVRSLRPVQDIGGPRRGFFGVDVTAAHVAREALRHQEETLRAMSVALPDLVARVDADGVVLDLLGESWELDETSDAGWRARKLRDLVGVVPHLTRAHVDQLAALTREPSTGPIRFELGAGTAARSLEWSSTAIPGRAEWLLVGRDVTAHSRAERQLALAERMASLGTLAAGMGHEINNPLAAVTWNLDVLADGIDRLAQGATPNLPDLAGAAQDARQGAERIRTIVQHLKRFARVDPPALGPVDLGDVIREAVSLTGHEVRHRARLDTRVGPVPPVLGDGPSLVQVFTNLLMNAAQAIPLGAADGNTIRVTADLVGDEVVATVTDTGRGIPPEELPRVFDPFFTTRDPGSGLGLGLSIAVGLLQDAGGHLAVESTPGRGTTFTLHLRTATPVARPPVHPVDGGARLRLLVVDDEPAVLRALARQLSTTHQVTTAASGDEACARLSGVEPFDAVVCDLHMPDRDGLDVLDWARRSRPALVDRFVFLTGGAFTARSQAFVASGRNRVLEKPVDRDLLRRTIAEAASAGPS